MEQLTDQLLECVDCGAEFEHSVDEQKFYASKKFESPKRCMDCRVARKHGGSRPQQQRDYATSDDCLLDPRAHYKIKCAQCKEIAFVPFMPKGQARCQKCNAEHKQRDTRMSGNR